MRPIARGVGARIFAPRPIERLAALRVLAPLAIVGFMASRIAHADDWLSVAGFRVPALGDWRQPLALPALPVWAAWAVGGALAASGILTALGAFTRGASAVFAGLLAYVALADRLAAFTVSKLSPVLALVLCLTPSGARYSVDAWRRRRRDPAAALPTRVSGGCVAFYQVMLPVFYLSSGICKATGDWLSDRFVLWTHLHDSYQTPVSWLLANHMPTWMWTAIQAAVLGFEVGAPLWFGVRHTRPFAFGFGLAMHLMIGLMFGPVIWFSLLMMSLLVASYAPERWLVGGMLRLARCLHPAPR
ncbi:MAG TPA: HTTM domain-containing protein [Kofleriaceae bacterium]|nr:HTTM domain-containing protein [Kofleriaceae bacterium]